MEKTAGRRQKAWWETRKRKTLGKGVSLEWSHRKVVCIVNYWLGFVYGLLTTTSGNVVMPDKKLSRANWAGGTVGRGICGGVELQLKGRCWLRAHCKPELWKISVVPSAELSSSSKILWCPWVAHFNFKWKYFHLQTSTTIDSERKKLVRHCIKHAGGLDQYDLVIEWSKHL